MEGLDISTDTIEELLRVETPFWLEDIKSIKEFYAKIGDRVPAEFQKELADLETRLSK